MADQYQLENIARVQQNAQKLLDLRVAELAVRPELGALNFADVLPYIQGTEKIARRLLTVDLTEAPPSQLVQLGNTLNNIASEFTNINNFNVTQTPDPSQVQRQYSDQVRGRYGEIFALVTPILAFLDAETLPHRISDNVLNALVPSQEKLTETINRSSALAQELQERLDSLKRDQDEVNQILGSVRKAAAETGVSQEAVYFSNEAAEHKGTAKGWLAATVIAAVITAAWGIVVLFLLRYPADVRLPEIVHEAIGKIIVLAALYFVLIWCSRNYRASRHNYVVNKHRQNALSTFETFVRSATSDEIKNAVLLQATTSIFAAQPSGYGGQEPEPEQPNKIIEIMRSFGGAGTHSG